MDVKLGRHLIETEANVDRVHWSDDVEIARLGVKSRGRFFGNDLFWSDSLNKRLVGISWLAWSRRRIERCICCESAVFLLINFLEQIVHLR